jgi:hypothetical protein
MAAGRLKNGRFAKTKGKNRAAAAAGRKGHKASCRKKRRRK